MGHIFYTIPELCAKAGKPIPDDAFTIGTKGEPPSRLVFFYKDSGDHIILSINDKFPLDECEACGKQLSEHTCGSTWKNDTEITYYAVCPKNAGKFKPRLATVRGIKLVKRCECGHEEIVHYPNEAITEEGSNCDSCSACKQFKPVQMVEVKEEVEI